MEKGKTVNNIAVRYNSNAIVCGGQMPWLDDAPLPRMTAPSPRLAKSQYELLAALRYALRRFQHFSQEAAHDAGLTPQQHQTLLTIKGFPDRDYASIGEIAARLHLRHHSVVGLVDRLVRRKLLRRTPSATDRRRQEVRLTSGGERLLRRLSHAHLAELREASPELRRLLESIQRKGGTR
jgi:DNA-binding MarR family transcriptional regulator